ncbi:MAG: hypothetical protein AABX39_00915 [Nanoarchaeota archaeon]
MKQKTLAGIILALASVSGAGCNSNTITEYDLRNPPTITNKVYQPEREYDSDDYVPVLCGDIVLLMYFGSTRMIDDEDHIIYLKQDMRGARVYYLNEEKFIYVNKETFDSFKVGDKCDLTKIKYETTDPDYVK